MMGMIHLFAGLALLLAVAPAAAAERWQPRPGDRWVWQLQGTLTDDGVSEIYDIDLFNVGHDLIERIHGRGGRVICYVSAGSSEDWRADFRRFAKADLGRPLAEWPGERWLDIRSANVRAIMRERIALAAEKGCDGVEPDNVDGYVNRSGFPLTRADQLDFNRFLAETAHGHHLAIGLKNAVDLLETLAPVFDFAVNEQCHAYGECAGYAAFVRLGKAVLNVEYARELVSDAGRRARMCAASRALGLTSYVLPLKLDGSFRHAC